MDVRLAPVRPDLRERLLRLAPRPDQERFAGRLAETLGVRRIVLSVNVGNPVAIRTYARAGFADTGELYLGGAAGPQHVLELWI